MEIFIKFNRMIVLLSLIFVLNSYGDIPKKCIESIESYELALLITKTNYSICDIDLNNRQCPCFGIKNLPLNCQKMSEKLGVRYLVNDELISRIKNNMKNETESEAKIMNEFVKALQNENIYIFSNFKSYQKLCKDNNQVIKY